MPKPTDHWTPARALDLIQRNVDRMYAGRTPFPTFSARNQRIWDTIRDRGRRFEAIALRTWRSRERSGHYRSEVG